MSRVSDVADTDASSQSEQSEKDDDLQRQKELCNDEIIEENLNDPAVVQKIFESLRDVHVKFNELAKANVEMLDSQVKLGNVNVELQVALEKATMKIKVLEDELLNQKKMDEEAINELQMRLEIEVSKGSEMKEKVDDLEKLADEIKMKDNLIRELYEKLSCETQKSLRLETELKDQEESIQKSEAVIRELREKLSNETMKTLNLQEKVKTLECSTNPHQLSSDTNHDSVVNALRERIRQLEFFISSSSSSRFH